MSNLKPFFDERCEPGDATRYKFGRIRENLYVFGIGGFQDLLQVEIYTPGEVDVENIQDQIYKSKWAQSPGSGGWNAAVITGFLVGLGYTLYQDGWDRWVRRMLWDDCDGKRILSTLSQVSQHGSGGDDRLTWVREKAEAWMSLHHGNAIEVVEDCQGCGVEVPESDSHGDVEKGQWLCPDCYGLSFPEELTPEEFTEQSLQELSDLDGGAK